MADFFKALHFVLENEGGYSNVKEDKGGETNFGITQATLNRFNRANPKLGLPDRVKALSIRDVEQIYRKDYWKFDGIIDQPIATKLFDMSVNMGINTAVKIIQRVVGVPVDGLCGPMTIQAINDDDADILMLDLVEACIKLYEEIITRDPSQEKFRRGWIRRAKKMPAD